jgi:hypothetical protein
MTKGEVDYTIRQAQNRFDDWNDCTGCFVKGTGYYYEALYNIEIACRIGAKIACEGMKADLSEFTWE